MTVACGHVEIPTRRVSEGHSVDSDARCPSLTRRVGIDETGQTSGRLNMSAIYRGLRSEVRIIKMS